MKLGYNTYADFVGRHVRWSEEEQGTQEEPEEEIEENPKTENSDE